MVTPPLPWAACVYIYICTYIIFTRCLSTGFAQGLPVWCRQWLEMGNMCSTTPACTFSVVCRQAGVVLCVAACTVHCCLCLCFASACSVKAARQQPRSHRGFLQGATAPRDAPKGCNLKTGTVTENYNNGIY